MRKFAALALFFSISFVSSYLVACAAAYIGIRIDAVITLPPVESRPLFTLFGALHLALPAALYVSALLSLSYAQRRSFGPVFTVIGLFVLGVLFGGGVNFGVSQLDHAGLPPLSTVPPPLGDRGLILSQGPTSVILLEEPFKGEGKRIVSLPGRDLFYVDAGSESGAERGLLPPAPFIRREDGFISNLKADIRLAAAQFEYRLSYGWFPFAVYLFPLLLLLLSFRFVFNLSAWPLANLFIGILVFRGILVFESLVDSREINELLGGVFGGLIPAYLISPCVFAALAALIFLYSMFAALAGKRRRNND